MDRGKKGRSAEPQQLKSAAAALILVRALARTGIIALVDEATGYQYERARDALAEILEAFIAKELAAWAKTFSDDFYREIFRLRSLTMKKLTSRPAYFGHLTNDIVYDRLAPGVLAELRAKNPANAKGRRRFKHFQWLTQDVGNPKLREHLAKVEALMKVSPDWETFIRYLDNVAPKIGATRRLNF